MDQLADRRATRTEAGADTIAGISSVGINPIHWRQFIEHPPWNGQDIGVREEAIRRIFAVIIGYVLNAQLPTGGVSQSRISVQTH
jgi:hypothetical protein